MDQTKNQQQINRITVIGMLVNFLLMLLKLLIGIPLHSISLIADGIHSLSDLATDIVVLFSTRFARRPADLNHPYGHGKLETVGTQVIAFVLLLSGAGIAWSSGKALFDQQVYRPGIWIIIIALISVVSKEVLFQMTRSVAKETHSSSLYANAWHHRSDAFSSVAVLLGGVAGLFGFGYGDQIAGLVVAFMIMGVAGKLSYENLMELIEHAADEASIEKIERVLSDFKEIYHWHKLRTRRIGSELYLDVHILVEPTISVLESHRLTEQIEMAIEERCMRPVNVLIHVEPHIDEMH
ncbi:cation transporter [candidate division KSB1 bacterium]|nr:cation transporter [candidate division KSB1 bacterium]